MRTLRLLLSGIIMLFGLGCSTSDDGPSVPKDVQVHDFIWRGLNYRYLWMDEVPNLADNRFASAEQRYAFYKNYASPEQFFQSLLYQPGQTDRFSTIYSDYNVLEQTLSGTLKNNGVDFALYLKSNNSDDVVGFVRYILPNSDASTKNIYRGDWFYAVNGVTLTRSNYQSLLAGENYTLHLANYNGGNFTPNGRSVNLTKQPYSENPVYYYTFFQQAGKRIGYLVYNGFYGDYDTQLNQAFGYFKANNVNELILDLRYNSGGLINSATHLASMITGQFNGQIFATAQPNRKIQAIYNANNWSEQLHYRFTNQFTNEYTSTVGINHLHLNRVYVLTTSSTASSSEIVINGLKPYINVIQIGGTTTGKNTGSTTMYDSPSFTKNGVNPNHRYAMQPLVLRIANSQGFGDYTQGLHPDYELWENYDMIYNLGNPQETFLAFTLGLISGQTSQPRMEMPLQQISDSKALEPLRTQMYIDSSELESK